MVNNRFVVFLLKLIPARVKRAMTLVSLYSVFRQERPDVKTLNRLNDSFRLVSYVDSLQVAARAPELCWSKSLCQKSFDTQQALVDYLLREMPDWLRYGNSRDIRHDISELLSFMGNRGVPSFQKTPNALTA